MISDTIEIKPIATDQKDSYQFECKGCIDIRADQVLSVLREVPANSQVLLNFEAVERVNSMGLSLLLKIFQEWEQNGTRVEVINLNRMVGMLFKITGLGSYIKKAAAVKATKPTASEQKPLSKPSVWKKFSASKSVEKNKAPEVRIPQPMRSSGAPRSGTQLQFHANFSNSFHRSGWLALSTLMQRQLRTAIRFEQCRNLPNTKDQSVDFFFANALNACSMIKTRGMIPVLCAEGSAEQVVLLSTSEDSRPLSFCSGAKVATATETSMVHILGRDLCDTNGLNSSSLKYITAGNEIKALQMLIKKQVDLAFIMKKTYMGLSSFSRDSTRLLNESNVSFSTPFFCMAPQLSAMKPQIVDLFTSMTENDAEQKILKDIQINSWQEADPQELKKLYDLVGRY